MANNDFDSIEIAGLIAAMVGITTVTVTSTEDGSGQEPFSTMKAVSVNPLEGTLGCLFSIPFSVGLGFTCAPFASSEDSSAPDLIINTENKCKVNQIEINATRDYNKYNKSHQTISESGTAIIAKDSESVKVLEDILCEASREDILFQLNVLENLLAHTDEPA